VGCLRGIVLNTMMGGSVNVVGESCYWNRPHTQYICYFKYIIQWNVCVGPSGEICLFIVYLTLLSVSRTIWH
jgi:hypothetical protein